MNRRSSKRRSSKRSVRPNFATGGTGTRESPIVIERIDDVDEFLGSPGFYQTGSAFPAYVVAKALDGWHPLFKGGMDMPFVEGSVFFFEVLSEPERHPFPAAVPDGEILSDSEHPLRANPLVAMGVSPDFWSKLLQRYRNWELAWWREVAQNSRDAQATQMDFSVSQGTYKDIETGGEAAAMVVTAYDNGVGMDADILRRALLTRGGSVKPESAVGGFGDAKNLILFPWLGWKVETRDLVAFGQHESVLEPPGVHRAPSFIQGTRITVWMPLTQTTSEIYAQQLLNRSYLPGVRVRVNGKTVAADLMGGEEVAKAGLANENGDVVGEIVANHHHSARANKGLYVRARGVFMFEEYAPNIPGVVYVDVNAPAKYVFDASRNALIGAAREFVEKVKARLAKEPEAMLRSKKWKAEKIYRGTGSIAVREGRASEVAAKAVAKVSDQLAKRQAQKKPLGAADVADLVKETTRAMEEDVANAPPPVTPEEETAQKMQSSRETATALINASVKHAATAEQVATAVRYAMWTPDLFMANQMPFWKPPAALEPETMEDKYIILLRAWTEACKFGLNILGEFRPFGVGFIMMLDGMTKMPVLGAYEYKDGTHWILINPVAFTRGRYDYEAREFAWELAGDRIDLSTDAGIEELCSTAVHEITHLQGFMDHDDVFISAMGKNMSICHRGQADLVKSMLPAIREQTRVRRAQIKKEKVAAKAEAVAKMVPWDIVVGRVTAILEWYTGRSLTGQAELNGDPDAIKHVAIEVGHRGDLLQRDVESLLGVPPSESRWRPDLTLKPKLIVQLHDEALAAGAFNRITDDDARLLSQTWRAVPPDPRVRQVKPRESKSPKTPNDGPAVFSWTRSGKDWVLREGYVGERGKEIMAYEGGVGHGDRQQQRLDVVHKYIDNALGDSAPTMDNRYVWLAISPTQWFMRLGDDAKPVRDEAHAARTPSVYTVQGKARIMDAGDLAGLSDPFEFATVAEAQKAVMAAVVRHRSER